MLWGEIVPDNGRASPFLHCAASAPLVWERGSTAWQPVHGPSHMWDCWGCSLAVNSSHSFPVFPPPLHSPAPQFPPSLPLPPLPQQQEAASLLLSNTTHCSLSHEDLVPGSSYVARVRARPGQASGFSGQYSEWSTEVSWKTPEGSMGWSGAVQGWKLRSQNFPVTYLALVLSEGGLQPRNLRCLFNGGDRLTCSWEVKKVIATSVLFSLFSRATPASEYVLCPQQRVCASPMGLLPVPLP